MPLKKFGEKLKSSLHHLSPKSKKNHENADGDLSPCSLPPTTVTQQEPSPSFPADPKHDCEFNQRPNETKSPEKEIECSSPQHKAPEPVRVETPVPTSNANEAAPLPQSAFEPKDCHQIPKTSTPRWEPTTNICPTMYYKSRVQDKEPFHQSVLLVNPSKSDKTFNLRLAASSPASLEKDIVGIQGAKAERVTVTITPENKTDDAYIDLLEGGYIYDKIRVQTNLR